ncbi:aldo/keto reductase [Mycolicibacterium sp. 050158]|uniref:aldo/keto reductase n=1 Tax=Mycolicibacterium sp. 050158 TaxID=3090602 RepID=UPI00299CDBDE|nr:aldo/keto reductase [Mycolicibacterium sp. 050158]MDX1891370.1 aldo/keto reductase [Mycolicibacterium sp. 050158]
MTPGSGRTTIRDLEVTRLGLGTAPLGGLFTPVAEDDATSTVDAAWDCGIRFFDTAPLYGYGNAERRLGRALEKRPRAEFTVATKVGRLLREPSAIGSAELDTTQEFDGRPFYRGTGREVPVFDFSYDGALRALEESLTRLGLDRVDLVHVHDADDHVEPAIDGAYRALTKLRDEGVVGAIGLGIDHCEPAVEILRAVDLDCVLIAGRWTLLDQSAAVELLPLAEARDVAIIAAGVFNSGVLADPNAPGATFDYVPSDALITARANEMAAVCARHGVPLKAAALQFPHRHPTVAVVLTGARTPAELVENATLADLSIPDDLWADLALECGVPTTA